MFAIIDVETTGAIAHHGKITEIAVIVHNGDEIIEVFETLINPDCHIPHFITRLTGISNEMVKDAPKFYEVARKIVELTTGRVFVAHNVNFDYGFIKEEYKRLGYSFSRKKLCTVTMSRRVFPGLRSYSLGAICEQMNISIEGRHRAGGDALATTRLFEIILKEQRRRNAKERGQHLLFY